VIENDGKMGEKMPVLQALTGILFAMRLGKQTGL
jgi:hypothetical protein